MIAHPHVKINLGLRVLRKRPDGFHDLETLFVPYHGLHDTLEIIAGDDWSHTSASLFERYGGGAGAGEDAPKIVQAVSDDGRVMITVARAEGVDWNPLNDLTVKAYRLLAADFDLPPVKIFLEKTAPVGAGLGGGSADAAFALRMYDSLAGLGLSDEALAGYAARLGSDCAFFLHDRPMLGTGRGEILSPAPAGFPAFRSAPALRFRDGAFLPFDGAGDGIVGEPVPGIVPDASGESLTLQVVLPEGIRVSTVEAYRGISPGIPERTLETILSQAVETWKSDLLNDFEPHIFALHPALAACKRGLYARGARYAAMSGSGSALFALY